MSILHNRVSLEKKKLSIEDFLYIESGTARKKHTTTGAEIKRKNKQINQIKYKGRYLATNCRNPTLNIKVSLDLIGATYESFFFTLQAKMNTNQYQTTKSLLWTAVLKDKLKLLIKFKTTSNT